MSVKTTDAAKTPSMKKTTDASKVRDYIRKCILLKFGTLTAYSIKENVSLQYVSNVLAGSKPMPDWMYKRFKITHVRVVNEHWEVAV